MSRPLPVLRQVRRVPIFLPLALAFAHRRFLMPRQWEREAPRPRRDDCSSAKPAINCTFPFGSFNLSPSSLTTLGVGLSRAANTRAASTRASGAPFRNVSRTTASASSDSSTRWLRANATFCRTRSCGSASASANWVARPSWTSTLPSATAALARTCGTSSSFRDRISRRVAGAAAGPRAASSFAAWIRTEASGSSSRSTLSRTRRSVLPWQQQMAKVAAASIRGTSFSEIISRPT